MTWSWPGEAGGATDAPLDAVNWFVVGVFLFLFCEEISEEETRGARADVVRLQ